jgi:hypothetical protein
VGLDVHVPPAMLARFLRRAVRLVEADYRRELRGTVGWLKKEMP